MEQVTVEASATQRLTELIREALEKETDPRVVADLVVRELDPRELAALVKALLPARVRREIHVQRSQSPRWARAAEDHASGGLDVLRGLWVGADGEWKRLGDFTLEDCGYQRKQYKSRTEEMQTWLDRFTALEARLSQSRRRKVASLGRTVVEEILSA